MISCSFCDGLDEILPIWKKTNELKLSYNLLVFYVRIATICKWFFILPILYIATSMNPGVKCCHCE